MPQVNKKLVLVMVLTVLAIAVLVAVVLSLTTDRVKTRTETAAEIAAKTEVKSFSISGRVSVIGRDSFEIKVGWVERTDQGNQYVMHDKKILVDAETKMYFVKNGSRLDFPPQASLSNLQLEEIVVVFGAGNPFTLEPVLAKQVDFILP